MNDLPLFPLNTVLFPGGRLPLRIFEQRYMTMAKACLKDGSPFGVCAIRDGKEVGDPAVPYDIGTLARIGDWDMPQLGVLQIIAQGGERFRILERRAQPDNLQLARVELLPEIKDAPTSDEHRVPVRILQRVIEEQPQLIAEPHRFDSCAWVSARLIELLPLSLGTKQELLELDDAAERMERLRALLPKPRPAA
jgi:Lon protease-like protein